MKKLILLYILLFSFSLLFAQKTPYFSKKVDFGYDENQSTILTTLPDGFVCYSGSEQMIYKLDTLGNMVWKRKLTRNATVTDGGVRNDTIFFVLVVYIQNNKLISSGEGDLLMQYFNGKGDSLNTVEVGSKKFERRFRILPTKDGNVLFAGNRAINSPYENLVGHDSLVVFKSDLKGKTLWERRIEAHDTISKLYYHEPDILFDLDNGSYSLNFLAGIRGKANIFLNNKFNFHTKFTDNGVVEKTKMVHKPKDGIHKFIPTKSKQFIGTIEHDDPAYINTAPSIITLMDYDMNIIKTGDRFGKERFKTNYPFMIKELKEKNNFICVGVNEEHDSTIAYINGNSGATRGAYGGPWIAKINTNCEILWERVVIDFRLFRFYDTGPFWSVTLMKNGDFLCTGDLYNEVGKPGTNDLWLVRLDSMGCPYPNCTGKLQSIMNTVDNKELPGEIKGVKVMPNPTQGLLWLEIPSDLVGQAIKITCFDINGRQVFEQSQPNSSDISNFDISAYPSGLYLIRIQDEKGRSSTKKILKQE